jgi:hypothetical protein
MGGRFNSNEACVVRGAKTPNTQNLGLKTQLILYMYRHVCALLHFD